MRCLGYQLLVSTRQLESPGHFEILQKPHTAQSLACVLLAQGGGPLVRVGLGSEDILGPVVVSQLLSSAQLCGKWAQSHYSD